MQAYPNQQQSPYDNNQQMYGQPPIQSQQYPPLYPNNAVQGVPIQADQQYMNNNQPYLPYQQQGYPGGVIVQPVYIQIQQENKLPSSADGCAFPATIECCYCKKQVKTQIYPQCGSGTYWMSFLLFLFFLPLFFLPCCLDDCKDKIHICPNCGKKVGKKKYKIC